MILLTFYFHFFFLILSHLEIGSQIFNLHDLLYLVLFVSHIVLADVRRGRGHEWMMVLRKR